MQPEIESVKDFQNIKILISFFNNWNFSLIYFLIKQNQIYISLKTRQTRTSFITFEYYKYETLILMTCSYLHQSYNAVSHAFGYGLMDAHAMVMKARNWTLAPSQLRCTKSVVSSAHTPRVFSSNQRMTISVRVSHQLLIVICF